MNGPFAQGERYSNVKLSSVREIVRILTNDTDNVSKWAYVVKEWRKFAAQKHKPATWNYVGEKTVQYTTMFRWAACACTPRQWKEISDADKNSPSI